MSQYFVEKIEVAVTLFMSDGLVREGFVYLSRFSACHPGEQTVEEIFNEPDPFIPLRKKDGQFCIIRKGAVTHLRFDRTAEDANRHMGEQIGIRIHFAAGEFLQGKVLLYGPNDKRRLQDFFNSARKFFQINSDSAHYLVNPEQISEVLPLTNPE